MRVLSPQTWNRILSLPYQTSHQETIDLTLNTWVGDPLKVADEWAKQWVSRFEKITQTPIPELPPIPKPNELKPGWNVFKGSWQPSDSPDGTLVFDTETHGKYRQLPILGVAVNKRYWYLWVSNWAVTGFDKGEYIELDPASLVIAHNASFDIGRVANSYRDDSPEWLDTLSLVQATNGLSKTILNTFKKRYKAPRWFYQGCGVSLKDAVTHWVRDGSARVTQDDKNLRDFFAKCEPTSECHRGLLANWDSLVGYAFNDVRATFHLFRVILPQYITVCPHLTSLMATSLMLRAKFPINPEFDEWVKFSNMQFREKLQQVDNIISEVARNTVQDDTVWSRGIGESIKVKGKPVGWDIESDKVKTNRELRAGNPKWYAKFLTDGKTLDLGEAGQLELSGITIRSRILPYLLRLKWNGSPIRHSKELGWYFVDSEGIPTRLPHKMGEDMNVGNPLSDVYRSHILDGTLTSDLPGFDLAEFHRLYFETTYWYGNRDRISEVVVRNNTHIPSIVPHRTVTRRSGDRLWLTVPDLKEGKIGTAIKSQIRIPDDSPYWLVGADFSTQEMNIAALLSDWWTNFELGSNDFSQMIFDGNKDKGTDIHSALANKFGIPRGSVAKPLNFAGLYNCGAKRYATVLKQGTKDVADPDALAVEILKSKRGEKSSALEPDWIIFVGLIKAATLVGNTKSALWRKATYLGSMLNHLPKLNLGGTDSLYYNAIDARLKASQPRTALLECRMPLWLESANASGDEFMTRANWVIQSTGVDILSMFLVLMDYFRAKNNLTFTYVVSRHDEVWFKAHSDEVHQVASLMQLAHLCVWASLANQLGIHALPESLCLFPEINVDKVLRKEIDLDVWDGFGLKPNPGYYIKSKEFVC